MNNFLKCNGLKEKKAFLFSFLWLLHCYNQNNAATCVIKQETWTSPSHGEIQMRCHKTFLYDIYIYFVFALPWNLSGLNALPWDLSGLNALP
jgi:hypothetical protein